MQQARRLALKNLLGYVAVVACIEHPHLRGTWSVTEGMWQHAAAEAVH